MRKCAVCGKPFKPWNSRQKHCGKACSDKAERAERMNYKPKACLWCRRSFKPLSKLHVYCCHTCKIAFKNMRKKILRLSEFEVSKREQCLTIFREQGFNSVFPFEDLNEALEQAKQDYARLKKLA